MISVYPILNEKNVNQSNQGYWNTQYILCHICILVWNDQAIILEHPERVFDHLYGFCEDDEKGWKSGLHTNTRVQLWINNIIKPKYSMLKSWILGDAASVSQLWHNLFSKYPPILYFLENSGRICFSRWNNCLRNISSTNFLA